MRRFLRWLLLALPVLYVIGAVGVFTHTVSDEKFKHRDYYVREAAFEALKWPRDIPEASRQAWRAAREWWEDFSW